MREGGIRIVSVLRVGALLLIGLVASGSGCSHAKISDEKESADAKVVAPPSMIYVRNFDLGAAKVQSDPGSIASRPRLVQLGHSDAYKELVKLGDELEQAIVDDLKKKGLAAQRLADDAARPASGWIIWGDFMEMKQGNRLERAIVGFGVGSASDKLYVSVADAAKPQGQDLLDFNVSSEGSERPGAAPGAIALHTPIGMAAAFVLGGDEGGKNLKAAAVQISDRVARLAGKAGGPE
jgi:hypothetical protein